MRAPLIQALSVYQQFPESGWKLVREDGEDGGYAENDSAYRSHGDSQRWASPINIVKVSRLKLKMFRQFSSPFPEISSEDMHRFLLQNETLTMFSEASYDQFSSLNARLS